MDRCPLADDDRRRASTANRWLVGSSSISSNRWPLRATPVFFLDAPYAPPLGGPAKSLCRHRRLHHGQLMSAVGRPCPVYAIGAASALNARWRLDPAAVGRALDAGHRDQACGYQRALPAMPVGGCGGSGGRHAGASVEVVSRGVVGVARMCGPGGRSRNGTCVAAGPGAPCRGWTSAPAAVFALRWSARALRTPPPLSRGAVAARALWLARGGAPERARLSGYVTLKR